MADKAEKAVLVGMVVLVETADTVEKVASVETADKKAEKKVDATGTMDTYKAPPSSKVLYFIHHHNFGAKHEIKEASVVNVIKVLKEF